MCSIVQGDREREIAVRDLEGGREGGELEMRVESRITCGGWT